MLQAREGGVVLGADAGEVGSRSITLNKIKLTGAEAVAGLGMDERKPGQIMKGLGREPSRNSMSHSIQ